jgi:hypothetical protein
MGSDLLAFFDDADGYFLVFFLCQLHNPTGRRQA